MEYEHKTVLLTMNELNDMRDPSFLRHRNIGATPGWKVIHSIQVGHDSASTATMFVLERPNPLQRERG